MAQGCLSYQYQLPKKLKSLTKFAGIGPYLDLIYQSGLIDSVCRHLKVRTDTQGWTDAQFILSLLLLNLVGGQYVSDIELLEHDPGLCRLMQQLESHQLSIASKHFDKKRWHQAKKRTFPSPTAIFDFLYHFHDPLEHHHRASGYAYIPKTHPLIKKLLRVLKEQLEFAQLQSSQETATLEQDATIDAADKQTNFYCYKGYKAYQPLNTYWFEQKLLVHSEFRDGNVNAGFDELRVFKEALAQLPKSVCHVFLRTDGAGYQEDLMQYCAKGEDPRFGVVPFAISAKVTPSFKESVKELPDAAWNMYHEVDERGHVFPTEHEWAEVGFVPNWVGHKKDNPEYRFIAIRERLHEPPNDLEALPFPTIEYHPVIYKLFSVVTNRFDLSGEELIRWHRQRCGKSEEVHKFQKIDLACAHLPSKYFGSNAAWWFMTVLSFNLISIFKKTLGKKWHNSHLKALRASLITIPGYVIEHGRQFLIRLGEQYEETLYFLIHAREAILRMGHAPPIA